MGTAPRTLAVVQRVLHDFPCFTPRHPDLRLLDGYLRAGGREYCLSLRADGAELRGDAALHALLAKDPDTVARRLSLAPDAHALLVELRTLVERIGADDDDNHTQVTLPPRTFYERLLRDAAAIGWNRVHVHSDLRGVDVICLDKGGRSHTLQIRLSSDLHALPKCTAALPEPFQVSTTALPAAVSQFEGRLQDFQLLWHALDDIDAHCDVLEPERANRAQLFRRIAIDDHTSVRFELDARAPTSAVPTCRFLGAHASVAPLRATLNANVHLWDSSGATLPRDNISRVLAVSLPKPRPKDTNDFDNDCGICYAYRLNDAVPDIACDRATCAKAYHRICLVEWLRALPDTKQSFDTLVGTCVYCELAITVNVND